MEERMRQSDRLESVGRLSAGVAHDLNNLLTPILGYAYMLQDEFPPSDENYQNVQEIIKAAESSRYLIWQLLAFSRKQIMEFKVVDVREIVQSMEKLLRQTIRENIEVKTYYTGETCSVNAAPSQILQVLMNLAVNAQDAMPNGGILTIEVLRVHLDEDYTNAHFDAKTGDYVLLAVSDNGVGMDEETKQHIFEPFFTTKSDIGTGLGLATVYGIVKQHGGNLLVYSEMGQGTTMKVYLPLHLKAQTSAAARETLPHAAPVVETILLVEDNEMVRRLAVNVLKKVGYHVLDAENGTTALEIAKAAGPSSLNLLLTDIIMPDLDGRTLADQVKKHQPEIKVLYMSGYTSNVIVHHGVLGEGVTFIHKPFSISELSSKVREALNKG